MARRVAMIIALGFGSLTLGCKTDERSAIVSNVTKDLEDAARQVNNIRTDLETATSKAEEKDEDGVKVVRLEKESVDNFRKGLKELKEQTVRKFQDSQAKANAGKPFTEDEKKALADANRKRLNDAIQKMSDENKELKKAFDEARKKDPKTTQELMEAYAEALGGLETIAQRK